MKTNIKKICAMICACTLTFTAAATPATALSLTDDFAAITTVTDTIVTAPSRVQVKVKTTTNTCTLSWNKVTCTGYYIYSHSTGQWKAIKTLSAGTTSYKLTNLQKKPYSFKIVPYKKVNGKIYKAVNSRTIVLNMATQMCRIVTDGKSTNAVFVGTKTNNNSNNNNNKGTTGKYGTTTPELAKLYGPMDQPPTTPKNVKFAVPKKYRLPAAVGCTTRLPKKVLECVTDSPETLCKEMDAQTTPGETDPRLVKKGMSKTDQAYYNFMVDEFTDADWEYIVKDMQAYVKKNYSYVAARKAFTYKAAGQKDQCPTHPAFTVTVKKLPKHLPYYAKAWDDGVLIKYNVGGFEEPTSCWRTKFNLPGDFASDDKASVLYNTTKTDVKNFKQACYRLLEYNLQRSVASDSDGDSINDKITVHTVLYVDWGYRMYDINTTNYESNDIICYRSGYVTENK